MKTNKTDLGDSDEEDNSNSNIKSIQTRQN